MSCAPMQATPDGMRTLHTRANGHLTGGRRVRRGCPPSQWPSSVIIDLPKVPQWRITYLLLLRPAPTARSAPPPWVFIDIPEPVRRTRRRRQQLEGGHHQHHRVALRSRRHRGAPVEPPLTMRWLHPPTYHFMSTRRHILGTHRQLSVLASLVCREHGKIAAWLWHGFARPLGQEQSTGRGLRRE